MTARCARGAVLLEALAALLVVAVAGSALLMQASAHVDAYQMVRDREREVARAAQVLAETALLDREALVMHLGRRSRGGFSVTVSRPRSDLFRVAVARADAPDAELLATALHRPRRAEP